MQRELMEEEMYKMTSVQYCQLKPHKQFDNGKGTGVVYKTKNRDYWRN